MKTWITQSDEFPRFCDVIDPSQDCEMADEDPRTWNVNEWLPLACIPCCHVFDHTIYIRNKRYEVLFRLEMSRHKIEIFGPDKDSKPHSLTVIRGFEGFWHFHSIFAEHSHVIIQTSARELIYVGATIYCITTRHAVKGCIAPRMEQPYPMAITYYDAVLMGDPGYMSKEHDILLVGEFTKERIESLFKI